MLFPISAAKANGARKGGSSDPEARAQGPTMWRSEGQETALPGPRQTRILVMAALVVGFIGTIFGAVFTTYQMDGTALAELPEVILETGTAGEGLIYLNGTSAKVSVVGTGNWWNTNYTYRRQITVTNNAAWNLSAGYSVFYTLDTASLVSAGKALLSGNDLRMVYWNGSQNIELDRVNETAFNSASTRIWFKTQREIPSGGSDSDYYVYYGFPEAGSPPSNRSNVYLKRVVRW